MIIFSVMLVYGLFYPVTPNHIQAPNLSSYYSDYFPHRGSDGDFPIEAVAYQDYLNETQTIFYPIWSSSFDRKSLQMSFFGRNMTLTLTPTEISGNDIRVSHLASDGSAVFPLSQSDLQCHYKGVVENCDMESMNCTSGLASISTCGTGLYGFLRIEDGDFILKPVQADEANSAVYGAHLAKRIFPLGTPRTTPEKPRPFQKRKTRRKRQSGYRPSSRSSKDNKVILYNIGVFVDDTLVQKMNRDFGTRTQHVNFVLQAFAAVNAMFNDPVFGPLIPTIRVMEIVFDMNHTRFNSGLEEPGQGEAQNYLGNFCEYVAENRYVNGFWRTDWDAWIALTALDLWAPVLQVSQDGLYKDRFRAEKVTEVLGLSYTGGACKPKRNCVIIEFNGFDVVDTIAHEIGHTLGMDHDPETDYTLPFEQKSNKIMALHAGQSRNGWSGWSVESYIEFMEKGRSPYCLRCPNDPCPDCGGYCLRKNRPTSANTNQRSKHLVLAESDIVLDHGGHPDHIYDVFYPEEPSSYGSRVKREAFPFPFSKSFSMFLFGRHTTVYLNKSADSPVRVSLLTNEGRKPVDIPTEDLRCHYEGVVESCLDSDCHGGAAVMSDCGFGLYGLVKVGEEQDTILLMPSKKYGRSRKFDNASNDNSHIAKRIFSPEVSHRSFKLESGSGHVTVPVPMTEQLEIVRIDDRKSKAARNKRHSYYYDMKPENPEDLKKKTFIHVGVYLDSQLMDDMGREEEYEVQHVNFIMLAFTAVNSLFDDAAFGDARPYARVVEIILDHREVNLTRLEGASDRVRAAARETGPGCAEATWYLALLCEYEAKAKKSMEGRKLNGQDPWDSFIGLTGNDLWAFVDSVRSDKFYAGTNPDLKTDRVSGVLGLAYTNGTCIPGHNCATIEFFRGFEMVDTIAHEIAHEVGADHDKGKDPKRPCWTGSNNVMAAHNGRARKGWSTCTAKAFQEYTTMYKNLAQCKGCPSKSPCDVEHCGGYCLANHKAFDVAGASTMCLWSFFGFCQLVLVVTITSLLSTELQPVFPYNPW